MNFFLIIQVLFDAVLLFGVLFLFHYSVHRSQAKKEESEILKNIQVQEIKENLQELLLTLKQLGKEVSDNIQDQVKEAEEKTEIFKKTLQKLNKDLNRALLLAEEVGDEKKRLEEKIKVIKSVPSKVPPMLSAFPEEVLGNDPIEEGLRPKKGMAKPPKVLRKRVFKEHRGAVGFSAGLVQEVYRLADSDLELNEIVQHTQLSRAEVQLILNLRDNRFTTPN